MVDTVVRNIGMPTFWRRLSSAWCKTILRSDRPWIRSCLTSPSSSRSSATPSSTPVSSTAKSSSPRHSPGTLCTRSGACSLARLPLVKAFLPRSLAVSDQVTGIAGPIPSPNPCRSFYYSSLFHFVVLYTYYVCLVVQCILDVSSIDSDQG
jgi:hypothetical protein